MSTKSYWVLMWDEKKEKIGGGKKVWLENTRDGVLMVTNDVKFAARFASRPEAVQIAAELAKQDIEKPLVVTQNVPKKDQDKPMPAELTWPTCNQRPSIKEDEDNMGNPGGDAEKFQQTQKEQAVEDRATVAQQIEGEGNIREKMLEGNPGENAPESVLTPNDEERGQDAGPNGDEDNGPDRDSSTNP